MDLPISVTKDTQKNQKFFSKLETCHAGCLSKTLGPKKTWLTISLIPMSSIDLQTTFGKKKFQNCTYQFGVVFPWNKMNLEWIFLDWRLFHFGFEKVTRGSSNDVWVFQTSLVLCFGHFQSFTFSLDCFYKKITSNVFHHHMLIISLFWTRIWQTQWNPTFSMASSWK